MNPISVTTFVEQIDEVLENFTGIAVEGEVDEFQISGGKWVRFSLKDEASTVRCFMPKWFLKTEIEDGMKVVATGRPKLTNKWGFSFNLSSVQPSGEGALKRAFELLKQKLTVEGLFADQRKRPLPKFPEHICLITSREAAAHDDFLKVLQARMGGLTISFIHTQVQGEPAPSQIVAALDIANTALRNLDAIVLVRGGGSLEDLQAFNDESVVRAVAASRTPTVVGVGHERDITLAELAADQRASTPSNAAELLVKDRQETLHDLINFKLQLKSQISQSISTHRFNVHQAITTLKNNVQQSQTKIYRSLELLNRQKQRISAEIIKLQRRTTAHRLLLLNQITNSYKNLANDLAQKARLLTSLSPTNTLARGYSITKTINGKLIKQASSISPGDVIITTFASGEAKTKVINVK